MNVYCVVAGYGVSTMDIQLGGGMRYPLPGKLFNALGAQTVMGVKTTAPVRSSCSVSTTPGTRGDAKVEAGGRSDKTDKDKDIFVGLAKNGTTAKDRAPSRGWRVRFRAWTRRCHRRSGARAGEPGQGAI